MEKSICVEEDEIICKCFQVTESEIRTCIAENDITEVENVTSDCEAGGNCQTCHILIQLFIDQHHQSKAVTKTPEPVAANAQNNDKGFFGKLFASA
jgi:NifU-like protein